MSRSVKELVDEIKSYHIKALTGQSIIPWDGDESKLWNDGATDAEIEQFEKVSGLVLPEDVKEWFKVINGQPEKAPIPFFFTDQNLWSLDQIRSDDYFDHYHIRNKFKVEELSVLLNFDDDSVPVYQREEFFSPYFIPMYPNDIGDMLLVDLLPGKTGKLGQVVTVGKSWLGENVKPITDSWKQYTEMIFQDILNGKISTEITEKSWVNDCFQPNPDLYLYSLGRYFEG